MATVLFIGDPHIKVENIETVNKFQDFLDKTLKENEVDFVVVGGDLLHTHERLHTLALNRAIEFLEKLSQTHQVYCLVGNHDMINNQQFLSKNHWMTCLEKANNRIRIIDKAVSISHNDIQFTLVPYVAPGRFVEAMEASGVSNWKESRVIFAHQEFKGCKMGAIVSEHGDVWDEDSPMVVSGHIHDNQRPQDNIYYPGAPIQHSYGDAGDNVVVLVKVDEEVSFHEIETGCGNKKTKTVTLEKIEEFIKKGFDEDVELKVNITGDANELKAFQKSKKYKELTEKGVKVNLKPTVIEMVPLSDDREEAPIESDFHTILLELLEKEKNSRVMRDYSKIFYSKEEEDVLFI